MQSITASQEKAAREATDERSGRGEPSVLLPKGGERATPKAISDHFFSGRLSVTEAMARMMNKAIDYINRKLEERQSPDTAVAALAESWTAKAMRGEADPGFRLPDPREAGFSYRAIAAMIMDLFDLDALSRDRELMKTLSEAVGLDLRGMTAKDLVKAFADPAGNSAKKVRDVLSNALAGEAGSKTMQRLEQVNAGRRDLEEVVRDAIEIAPGEEYDEEMRAERLADIEAARAAAKLEELVRRHETALREREEAKAEAERAGPNTASSRAQTDGQDGELRVSLIVAAYAEHLEDDEEKAAGMTLVA